MKRSRITVEFGIDDLRAKNPDLCIPLFVLKQGGKLLVCTEGGAEPEPGDTLLVLVDRQAA